MANEAVTDCVITGVDMDLSTKALLVTRIRQALTLAFTDQELLAFVRKHNSITFELVFSVAPDRTP